MEHRESIGSNLSQCTACGMTIVSVRTTIAKYACHSLRLADSNSTSPSAHSRLILELISIYCTLNLLITLKLKSLEQQCSCNDFHVPFPVVIACSTD